MSWWWLWGSPTGPAEPIVPTTADNAPSLWGGGVRWGDPDAAFGDGTDAYWGGTADVARSGFPRLSVAIGGDLVLNQLRRASWGLGRPDWMSTLTPTSASFEFVDVPVAAPNDTIVVGLMSDTEEHHSRSLWVGRVADVTTRRDIDGTVTSTIGATDVIGVLGQAMAPSSIAAGHTLGTLTERLAADAGMPVRVVGDPLVTLPVLIAAGGAPGSPEALTGTVLDLVNRAERSSNALLFLRGDGSLRAAMRDATGAASARVVTLDGDDSPAGWTEQTGLRNVITRWELGNDAWRTDTLATTHDEYGDRAFSATDLLVNDPAPYASLIASDVLATPRAVVVDAPFHVRDMSQQVLTLDPLDRVVSDGATWQVMSVSHEVTPIRLEDGRTRTEWRMAVTADATQEALVGAAEPGPVEPPRLHTVTLEYTSTKAGVAELEADGTRTGSSVGDLLVGRFANGSRYRAAVEWDIVWPHNMIRVVSATVRFQTASPTEAGRISIRRAREAWGEGTMDWPGPHTHTDGERTVSVPKGAGKAVTASITTIAQDWHDKGNHGLRLASTNEGSTVRRAVLYSDDSSDPSSRPRLTLVIEVVS